MMRRRQQLPLVCLCLALVIGGGAASAADIVQQIISRVPDQPRTYEAMRATLLRLAESERVSLVNLGRSVGGRDILCVALHAPGSVFGQTKRLFVVARQHGNEPSGTEAVMALIEHFATSQGALEQETLRRLTFIFVPMANPDSADRSRRRNGRNADLNRDWQALSQPETLAIEKGVRAWKPDALVDLHGLPRSSSRASYRENFVETIGQGGGIPAFVSNTTIPVSSDLASWLRIYGHRYNIYYDGPGKDRRLCHRHFGLDHGIPSFLFEAKNGPGRTLKHRAGFHSVGLLVIANHLVNNAGPTGGSAQTLCRAADGTTPSVTGRRAAPAGPRIPTSVALQQELAEFGQDGTGGQLRAVVAGSDEVRYVKFYVNGRLWTVTNSEPYNCELDPTELGTGRHQVKVDVVGQAGKVLAQAQGIVDLDTVQAAGR